MKSIEEHISFINAKTQELLKKFAALKKENFALVLELEKFREKEMEFLNRIDTLEMQVGILKTSLGKLEDKEKKDLEKRINQYIKELDKCMILLNN